MVEPVKKLDWANRRRTYVQKMITTKAVLDVLADAFVNDKYAIMSLESEYIPCKTDFLGHSHGNRVNFLDVINEILIRANQPPVKVKLDDNGKWLGFEEAKY